MIDIAELEARLGKAKSRKDRAKFAYDSASAETDRLETALSVVREMMGVTTGPPMRGSSLTTKQQILLNSLKNGQNNALSPADIYHVASQNPAFDGDVPYVRTTLWRMADKGSIGSANGVYWRFEEATTIQAPASPPSELLANSAELPAAPAVSAWDPDLDDLDVSF
jgi:hypothetical protein